MDPFAAVGLVAIGGALGYIAAAQKYGKLVRTMREKMFSMNLESVTRLCQAAIGTLVEDYGHPVVEAQTKLFKRCNDLGMRLMSAKPDGSTSPVNPQEKIS